MNHEPENPLHGGTHERHKPGDDERHDRHGEDEHHHHGPWKLNVQGVIIESPQPEIVVRQAIKQAGFNPDTPWIIILKVAGEPKREVDLSFVIDLRHKGIEKLRLTPRQINNGEMATGQRVEFALLPQDVEHLNHLGLRWETLIDGGRRWFILRNYPLPPGYRSPAADIAIEVPISYPGAQLDMFYCHPPLALNSGAVIPQTQCLETITGLPFQRWSRHRQWDATRDTLSTHLALVDESLQREVGQ
ncbi:MAG TPA: E2/UBC family protein [Candidatus Binataceae bacterium]|nr:E2/UBC family protein [Candidatus Binataceae bacterium]